MFKKSMTSKIMKSIAAFMAATSGALPSNKTVHFHNEACPDLGLPRPKAVQDRLIANARAKRARKAARFYNKTLPNGKIIMQQWSTAEM